MDDIYIPEDDKKQIIDNMLYCLSIKIDDTKMHKFTDNHLLLNICTNNTQLLRLLNDLFLFPNVINDIIYKYCANIWFLELFNVCYRVLKLLDNMNLITTLFVNEDVSFNKHPTSFCYDISLRNDRTFISRLKNKYTMNTLKLYSKLHVLDCEMKHNDGLHILHEECREKLSIINFKYFFDYFLNNMSSDNVDIPNTNKEKIYYTNYNNTAMIIKKINNDTYTFKYDKTHYDSTIHVYNKNIVTKIAKIMLFIEKLMTNIYLKRKNICD
jgi:hypothetical protein